MAGRYLTAAEAALELGVTIRTLYAYVSRGLIRSEGTGARRQGYRYYREDIERLKQRKEQRRDPGEAAASALDWGTPLMDSRITLIENCRLYYRGLDALDLCRRCTVEQVAALIWTGSLDGAVPTLSEPVRLPASWAAVSPGVTDLDAIDRFKVALTLAAAEDPAAYDLRPEAIVRAAGRILRLLAVVATGTGGTHAGIVASLQEGWNTTSPPAGELLNAALILCADHELNVSSFTARCVASAGSPLYAALSAGIAALQGVKHGANTGRVAAFFREAGTAAGVRSAIAGLLKRGELVPGFGHRLYPDGDPRGRELLERLTGCCTGEPAVQLALAAQEEMAALLGEHPTIDLALVAAAGALHLPPDAPLTLFALGRTIGWVGHALEQYEADRLIRPRARYTGPAPAAAPRV
jgi:citrate synthase